MQLKIYLEINNITPDQFALIVGCSKDAVYKWCSGDRKPKDEILMQRIFEITGGAVTANDFYGLETVTPPAPIDSLTQAANGLY
jgi:hypothetical protein